MATGSLIKIDEEIVTSAVSSVTLTGIDSTYDVYMVKLNNVSPATANIFRARITKDVAGTPTPQTTTNYDFALKGFKTSGSFENNYNSNQNYIDVTDSFVNASTGNANLIMYIFNANNSSEYTFLTIETSHYAGAELYGNQGGAVYTVAEAHNGIQFYFDAINTDAGTFTLYGLKK
jgi:hypothetical protein